ncbi:hypothetical protein ROZALSC1DRAFT_30798 [Rozella allomycis CSF55]|uniref:Uncharacterized protein n=1 Tax=Rozella allomycis (strain CSF55) TaxID=988480 RepID=A0A4P9YDH2_ROZAC|nr:hypothetical protein ROZALSC1DRAFT_30798 [Rozella allomycis CSF55]
MPVDMNLTQEIIKEQEEMSVILDIAEKDMIKVSERFANTIKEIKEELIKLQNNRVTPNPTPNFDKAKSSEFSNNNQGTPRLDQKRTKISFLLRIRDNVSIRNGIV